MKKISIILAMVLTMGMLTAGIASAEEKKTGDCPVTTTVVVIGDSSVEAPEAIEIASGDYLEVVLYAAGGTGYGWMLDSERLISIETVADSSSPVSDQSLPGGKVRWEFCLRVRPEAIGQEALHFYLSRPWEKDKKPAQVFDLTVVTK